MWDAVSSHKTLGVMTVAACIFVPIILIIPLGAITKCGVSLPINTFKKIHIVCTKVTRRNICGILHGFLEF
jgi:hypothetical protein